jgi:hypothetical protein
MCRALVPSVRRFSVRPRQFMMLYHHRLQRPQACAPRSGCVRQKTPCQTPQSANCATDTRSRPPMLVLLYRQPSALGGGRPYSLDRDFPGAAALRSRSRALVCTKWGLPAAKKWLLPTVLQRCTDARASSMRFMIQYKHTCTTLCPIHTLTGRWEACICSGLLEGDFPGAAALRSRSRALVCHKVGFPATL